jgi:hypothetical protein
MRLMKLKLKLIYDRQSVGQSVLVSIAHLGPVPIFLSPLHFLYTVACLLFCSILSDERTGLLFTVQLLLGLARAVTLGSHSRRTHNHILLSLIRLPQSGGPGSHISIPQEQGGPIIPPGTGLWGSWHHISVYMSVCSPLFSFLMGSVSYQIIVCHNFVIIIISHTWNV